MLLTKSLFTKFIQCPKLAFISKHRKAMLPPLDTATKRIFANGEEVNVFNQSKGGKIISTINVSSALEQTKKLLENTSPQTIYEAAIQSGETICRVDELQVAEDGSFTLIEVKSSTEPKEIYIQDICFQYAVLLNAGHKVSRAILRLINNQATTNDEIFLDVDMTAECVGRLHSTQLRIKQALEVLKLSDIPVHEMSENCEDPYKCPMMEHCKKEAGFEGSKVLEIPRLGKKKYSLIQEGIKDLKEVPLDLLDKTQLRILQYMLEGERYINKEAIQQFMGKLVYPLYFMDFETINRPLIKFPKTKPYQQVPFQFSIHKMDNGGELTHFEYLHTDETDPRESFALALSEAVGNEGTIISYNAPFEIMVVGQTASVIPLFKTKATFIKTQTVDLLPLMRNHTYDPAYKGSFSIKTVSPALTGGGSYKDLAVGDGVAAQIAWEKMIVEKDPEKKQSLISDLKLYCAKDTMEMVNLFKFLEAV